jgi:hypothetical protein
MDGDEGAPVASHAEVLEAVEKRSIQMQTLVKELVAQIKNEILPKLPPLRMVSLLVSDEDQTHFHREHLLDKGKQHVIIYNDAIRHFLIGASMVAIGVWIGRKTAR